jgi:hypothetical protein
MQCYAGHISIPTHGQSIIICDSFIPASELAPKVSKKECHVGLAFTQPRMVPASL